MDEELYKLEVLVKIKKAISAQYSEIDKASTYHECMEMLLDIENEILNIKED